MGIFRSIHRENERSFSPSIYRIQREIIGMGYDNENRAEEAFSECVVGCCKIKLKKKTNGRFLLFFFRKIVKMLGKISANNTANSSNFP